MDTFAEASDNSQANLNGGSPRHAALGQVKESCPAGPQIVAASHPKILNHPTPPALQSFPLALQIL
jgi:hypothetical protein